MKTGGAKGAPSRGLLYCAVPERGRVYVKPNNGRKPGVVFPNCVVFTPEIHQPLEQKSETYWHPAARPLQARSSAWIVNFCADADDYRDALQHLKRRCGSVPVFNRPDAVLQTARDRVTSLLEGIPGLVLPKCHRFSPRLPEDFEDVFARGGFSYPVLIRPTASQTGFGLVKVDSPAEWEKIFSIDWAGREIYMTQFVDLRDEAGLHCKVRIAFVNRQPFFRHVFSSTDPIVRTYPRTTESMDKEIEFLAGLKKRPAVQALVAALAERVRLNFWGIDIGIGTGDSFLFYEATAAMSITQAYSTQEEHDRLFPVFLEPIHRALSAAVGTPASWDCWA